MPPLSSLALRYVAWFVGLSILYGLLVNFAALPSSLATGVILASAPAAGCGPSGQAPRDAGAFDCGLGQGLGALHGHLPASERGRAAHSAATVAGLREGSGRRVWSRRRSCSPGPRA